MTGAENESILVKVTVSQREHEQENCNMADKTIEIRGVCFGNGTPRICVPLVSQTREALAEELSRLAFIPWDLVEWRADFYESAEDPEAVEAALKLIREKISGKPLLFTVRTSAEGGAFGKGFEEYRNILLGAARTGLADLTDVQLMAGTKEQIRALTEELQAAGTRVIGSFHDFEKTPAAEEMTDILCRMQELGMDMTKIAVMPRDREDVLELLKAAVLMDTRLGDRPCVSMSMGRDGLISRIAGSFTGSAITFASASRASAPGQIAAEKMAAILLALEER